MGKQYTSRNGTFIDRFRNSSLIRGQGSLYSLFCSDQECKTSANLLMQPVAGRKKASLGRKRTLWGESHNDTEWPRPFISLSREDL